MTRSSRMQSTDVIMHLKAASRKPTEFWQRRIHGRKHLPRSSSFLRLEICYGRRCWTSLQTTAGEWRNPSTHDHTMDFDEDEALLAIVSVTVFAIVLCDQIESKIAFNSAAAATPATDLAAPQVASLLDLVTNAVLEFAGNHVDTKGPSRSPAHDYYRLEGELAGYLSANLSVLEGVDVVQNQRMSSREADVVVTKDGKTVIVELKRTSASASVRTIIQRAVTQAAVYLHEHNVVGAVAFVYSARIREYQTEPAAGALADLVRVVAPQADRNRSA
jgi:hypothetical protein